MSKYTTEVRFICESLSGLGESKGDANVSEIIEKSRKKIFDFAYPIYDENYRSVIETKILKHFYTREIGSETVGLWKLWLDTKMNEIMPYYNQMYESTLVQFNPLLDTDYTTKHEGKNDGNKKEIGETSNSRDTTGNNVTESSAVNSNSVTGNNDAWNYYSDTPQGGVTGLADMTYLTNASHDTATKGETQNGSTTGKTETGYDETVGETGTRKNESTFKNTDEYVEHITGKRGVTSYSKMLQEFRDTFLNIDMKVIHELDDMFINLW